MQKLLLIKHALPNIDPNLPAAQWELSQAGKSACTLLAKKLAVYNIQKVISSEERKAIQTATITAALLKLPHQAYPKIHEHDRRDTPYFDSKTDFQKAVKAMFDSPNHLAYGNETANQAVDRFEEGLSKILHSEGDSHDIAIVTHGTVMSLFASRHNSINAFELWKRLSLPSLLVLSLPDFRLLEMIERID